MKAPLDTPVVAQTGTVVVLWLLVLAGVNFTFCRDLPPAASQDLLAPKLPQADATKNAPLPCLKPARLPGINDYDGPLKKTVGLFAPALERKSVHPPRYKPGARLCSLDFGDKFRLFVRIPRTR